MQYQYSSASTLAGDPRTRARDGHRLEPHDCRCHCGSLLARLVGDRLEVKCRRCKRVVTIEDHNTVGGLAGAVSEVLMATGGVSLLRLGISEAFGESGTGKELYRHFGIDGISIAEKVIHWLEKA